MSFYDHMRLNALTKEIEVFKKIKMGNKKSKEQTSGLNNIVEPLRFFSIGKLGKVVEMPFYT